MKAFTPSGYLASGPHDGVLFGISDAGWSSPVAREAHNLEVAGSNPVPATRFFAGLVSADTGSVCEPCFVGRQSELSTTAATMRKDGTRRGAGMSPDTIRKVPPSLLLVAVLACCSYAREADVPPVHTTAEQKTRVNHLRELYLASVEARQAGDHSTEARLLDEARRGVRDSPRLTLHAARAHALAGDNDTAFELLTHSVELGFGLEAEQMHDFASLVSDPRFDVIRVAIEMEKRPRGKAVIAARLTERNLMPEGLARDPRSDTLYLSSLRRGKIVAVDKDGQTRDFVTARQDGLWCMLGLVVDTDRDLLWVASAGQAMLSDVEEAEIDRAGLFAFRLADGALEERHVLDNADGGHLLNDLTLARDGTLLVTDTEEGSVWRCVPGERRLARLTESGAVSGANGIALSKDETRLYVAWDLGIAVVDRDTGEVRDLSPPRGATLTGVDGLEFYHGALIAIQTAIERVSRFELSADGWSVTEATTLLARHPLFDFPTTGDLDGDAFYFIANAQVLSVDTVDHRSVPWPAERLKDPIVLRVDLAH